MKKIWLPFEEAREIVRKENLKNEKPEWRIYSKSGKKPHNIPSTPARTYKNQWKGWGDWLGCGDFHIRLEKERLAKEIQPSQRQIEIIDANMLGDGSIEIPAKNARLSCQHSEKQMHYTDWFTKQLDFISFNFTQSFRKGVQLNKKGAPAPDSETYCAESRVHSYFTKQRARWYPEGKKIVPLDLVLTPLMIAIWHFDDGSLCVSTRQVILSTNSFTQSEVEFLINQLINLGITDCQMQCHISKKNKPTISIGSRSIKDFINMVSPFLPKDHPVYDELFYKIDISNMTEPKYYHTREKDRILIKQLRESGYTYKQISSETGFGKWAIVNTLKNTI